MRTKNLNLKKKIAFIASVAMIATTAAYLPNEVTKDIFTSSITVEAHPSVIEYVSSTDAYVALANTNAKKLNTLNAFIKIDGKYLGYNKTAGAKNYKLVDTLNDTEYPAVKAFGSQGDFSLEGKSPIDDLKDAGGAPAAPGTADVIATDTSKYYVKKVAQALEIPYFPDAKKVEIVFEAKKGARKSARSLDSVEVTFDDHGIGRLGKMHDYVVGMSATSNFDEATGKLAATPAGEYEVVDLSGLVVAMTGANNMTTATDRSTTVVPESLDMVGSALATAAGYTLRNDTVNSINGWVINNALTTSLDESENEVKPDSYDLMRVNGHFARVIALDANKTVAPGTKIDITTNKHAAWDEAGSKDGVVSVTMGSNKDYPNYAVSNLVTFSNNGKKEYFVYVVKNLDTVGMSDAAGTNSRLLTIDDDTKGLNDSTSPNDTASAGKDENETTNTTNGVAATHDKIPMIKTTNVGRLHSVAADGKVAADTRYKIKKEIVKETVDNKQYYVTQYTVYNNETKEEYKQGDRKTYSLTFDLTGAAIGAYTAGAYDYTKVDVSANPGVTDPIYQAKGISILESNRKNYTAGAGTTANPYTEPAAGYTGNDPVIAQESGDTLLVAGTNKVQVVLKKTAAGTAESEVLRIGQGTASTEDFIKIVFTNEYQIKVNHDWADAKEDLTKKDYDEKVDVYGQKVDKPDKMNRLGFDFEGWQADLDGAIATGSTVLGTPGPQLTGGQVNGHAGDAGDVDIFRTDDWSTQYHEDTITPNVTLVAKYKGQRCDIVLDANGGQIDIAGTAGTESAGVAGTVTGSKLSPEYKHGQPTKVMTKSSFFSLERLTSNNDLSYRNATATKAGYDFIGWSTEPDATKKMSVSEIEAAFPGEDKTLTLYAVYEAKDNISVNFKQIMFDANGVTFDTDGKTNKYDADGQEFVSAANGQNKDNIVCVDDATFDSTPSITLTAGQPIGELPVPYEKGYDFDGWYAKTFNNTLTSVEYVKVDKNTVVDEKLFADPAKNFNGYGTNALVANTDTVTLYAKFSQKMYNITFDIGDGAWESSDIAKEDGKLPAIMTYSAYRGAKGEAEKLGFRRPDGEVISVDEWKEVKNPQNGSGEINEFSKWTINGKGNYSDLAAVATALTKRNTLEDVVVKAVYEDTESSKSKIYLNANEGDFYAYYQADKNPTTKAVKQYILNAATVNEFNLPNGKSYAIDAAKIAQNVEGEYYGMPFLNFDATTDNYDSGNVATPWVAGQDYLLSLSNFQQSGLDLDGGTAGIKVSSKWNISGRNIEQTSNAADAKGYTVARAGYDFTGWYTDKECTNKYTFTNYPAKGTEVVLYAGWKKSTTTRYWLEFDIFKGDGSEAKVKYTTDADLGSQLKWKKTYMGTIDEVASAKDLKVSVQDGEGTQSTYKNYVFDPELSKNLNDTSKKLKCEYSTKALASGLFEQAEPYTTIYGRFVEEGFQSEEQLEAPTNVKVVNGVVTWKGSDVATGYRIKKIVGDKVSYGALTDKTTATIKNIPEEDYQVAVVAYDKNGKTATSTAVDVIVAPSTLEAPTNVKVSETGEVTWDAAKGAVKYQVLKVVGNTKAYTAKTTELSAQLKSTASDYKVYVIAFDSNGKSKRSEAVDAKAFSNGLGVVTDAKYAADTKTVTWTAVDNAVKYQVLKVVNGKKFYGPYVTGTSYTFKSVPDGAFAYYVIAKDANGNSTRGTMNKVTNHPSVTDVKLADDNKTVTFKAVEGATGYQLCKIVPGKSPAYSAISTNTTITFKNACTSGTQVYVLAFFDEAHKDASYSETIIVK